VPIVPSGFIHQAKVEEAVRRAETALRPDVVLIRYSMGSDWTGDPSIFFRILITDEASKPVRLQQVAQRIADRLINEVRSDEFGIHAYFNFRSKSEQDKLKEPAWA
jgi:hypothetical protein